jgi:Ca2+-binding EF-hand superfamily protein
LYEFTNAINDLGVQIAPADINSLFKSFDQNSDGVISYAEFISVAKMPLNEFRQNVVRRVFKKLDFYGEGAINVSEILAKFNAG